jgi:hypothetical protein
MFGSCGVNEMSMKLPSSETKVLARRLQENTLQGLQYKHGVWRHYRAALLSHLTFIWKPWEVPFKNEVSKISSQQRAHCYLKKRTSRPVRIQNRTGPTSNVFLWVGSFVQIDSNIRARINSYFRGWIPQSLTRFKRQKRLQAFPLLSCVGTASDMPFSS